MAVGKTMKAVWKFEIQTFKHCSCLAVVYIQCLAVATTTESVTSRGGNANDVTRSVSRRTGSRRRNGVDKVINVVRADGRRSIAIAFAYRPTAAYICSMFTVRCTLVQLSLIHI